MQHMILSKLSRVRRLFVVALALAAIMGFTSVTPPSPASAAQWPGGVPGTVVLSSGGTLGSGAPCVFSPNHWYRVCMQPDGNLVLYNRASQPLWNTYSGGHNGQGIHAVMQPDGNLVLYPSSGQAVWNTQTWWNDGKGIYLYLQDDANLVLYTGNSAAIWATNGLRSMHYRSCSSLDSGLYMGTDAGALFYASAGDKLTVFGWEECLNTWVAWSPWGVQSLDNTRESSPRVGSASYPFKTGSYWDSGQNAEVSYMNSQIAWGIPINGFPGRWSECFNLNVMTRQNGSSWMTGSHHWAWGDNPCPGAA